MRLLSYVLGLLLVSQAQGMSPPQVVSYDGGKHLLVTFKGTVCPQSLTPQMVTHLRRRAPLTHTQSLESLTLHEITHIGNQLSFWQAKSAMDRRPLTGAVTQVHVTYHLFDPTDSQLRGPSKHLFEGSVTQPLPLTLLNMSGSSSDHPGLICMYDTKTHDKDGKVIYFMIRSHKSL